jgi:hypothetical protein
MALRAGVFALLLVNVGAEAAARASHCAPISGGVPELGNIDAEVRLRFLRDRLKLAAHKTRIWAFTWTGIYSSVIVYNLAQLNVGDRDNLIDNGIGASASLVGVLSVALLPPKIIGDQFWLERRLRHAAPGTDVCALLAEAEGLLVRDAKGAAFGKSPLVHAGSFVFNVGVGFLLGFGFGHWGQAALQSLLGIAVGEVMIFTQPAEIVRDLSRYRAGNLGLPPAWRPLAWGVAPIVGPDRAGMVLGLSF